MSNMVFTALCVLLCATQALATNPVIGVLSQYDHNGVPYIAASYVKYLESAGARVVPILHTDSSTELKRLFSKLNGFFIPGGGANLASMEASRRALLNLCLFTVHCPLRLFCKSASLHFPRCMAHT